MENVYEIQRIKQVVQEVEGGEQYLIRSPEDGVRVAAVFIGDEDREVFKSAILNNAASIIVSHQHPSQDCDPSHEDIEITKCLVECGRILGIEVLDHVIVNASGGYVSFLFCWNSCIPIYTGCFFF
ncbi:DNA repair protein RadC [Aneurinibacillus sp. BA2021]|nr:DNA repair protein RadC [Aneurinibacillus sp. BA2021]